MAVSSANMQMIKDEVSLKESHQLPTVTDGDAKSNHNMNGEQSRTHCVYPEGGGTQASSANMQNADGKRLGLSKRKWYGHR